MHTSIDIVDVFAGWPFLKDYKREFYYLYFKKDWKKDRVYCKRKYSASVKVFRTLKKIILI